MTRIYQTSHMFFQIQAKSIKFSEFSREFTCEKLSMAQALHKMTISPHVMFAGSLQANMHESEMGPQKKKAKTKKWINVV